MTFTFNVNCCHWIPREGHINMPHSIWLSRTWITFQDLLTTPDSDTVLSQPNTHRLHTQMMGRFTHQSKFQVHVYGYSWLYGRVNLSGSAFVIEVLSNKASVSRWSSNVPPPPLTCSYTVTKTHICCYYKNTKYLIAQYHQLFCQNLLPQYPLVSHLNPTPQSLLTDQS